MQCFGSFSALTCMTRQYSLPARPALVQLRSQALAQCGPSVLVVSVAGVADRHPAGKAGKELCLLQNQRTVNFQPWAHVAQTLEIGRASCRESVGKYV